MYKEVGRVGIVKYEGKTYIALRYVLRSVTTSLENVVGPRYPLYQFNARPPSGDRPRIATYLEEADFRHFVAHCPKIHRDLVQLVLREISSESPLPPLLNMSSLPQQPSVSHSQPGSIAAPSLGLGLGVGGPSQTPAAAASGGPSQAAAAAAASGEPSQAAAAASGGPSQAASSGAPSQAAASDMPTPILTRMLAGMPSPVQTRMFQDLLGVLINNKWYVKMELAVKEMNIAGNQAKLIAECTQYPADMVQRYGEHLWINSAGLIRLATNHGLTVLPPIATSLLLG
jgi:hypothetical protein